MQEPRYGIRIQNVLEDSRRVGQSEWIDLLTVEDQLDIEDVVDALTGRAEDPYPERWNNEGTFEVVEVRGLGPRLAAMARDVDGPFAETIADLAWALQRLPGSLQVEFLAWAECDSGNWWLPGHEVHPAEDAVLMFELGHGHRLEMQT